MELIKENLLKKRSVYKTDDFIRKYWHDKTSHWVKKHVCVVQQFAPDLILRTGQDCTGVYVDMKIVTGELASTFQRTDEFIKRIYKFCLENIEETKPFVHGDWTLSNMIVDGDKITMIDWDNVGIYPRGEVMKKLRSDMISSFGERFLEVMNDSAGV
jgi:thiamine kinase-like enzyme